MKESHIKYFILSLLFIFLFIVDINVFAFSVGQGKQLNFTNEGGPKFPYKNTTIKKKNYDVYCSEFYKGIPKKCSQKDKNWNENSYVSAGISNIIKNSELGYGLKEILINYFLEKQGFTYSCSDSKECPYASYFGKRGKGGYSYIYLSGSMNTKIAEEYDKIIQNLYEIFEGRTKPGSIKLGEFSEKGDNFVSTLYVYNTGNYNTNYNVTITDGCTVNFIKHHSDTGYGNQRDDLQITCPSSLNGTEIKIKVTGINVYKVNRYDCGYGYQKVFISNPIKRSFEKTITLPKKNNSCYDDKNCACVNEFNQDNSRINRIKLYRKYGFNNLLNFNEDNAVKACSTVSCKTSTEIGCLSSNIGLKEDFDENNLSCFDDFTIFWGYTEYSAFCKTEFSISSNLTEPLSYVESISGQLLYKTTNPLAARGTLRRECYAYKGALKDDPALKGTSLSTDYNKYVKDVNLKDESDSDEQNFLAQSDEKTEFDLAVYEYNDYYKFVGKKSVDYNFKSLNLNYYGIPSRKTIENGTLNFSYKFNSDSDSKSFEEITGGKCYYKTTEMLSPSDLEFRLVSSTEFFPGLSGNQRNTGRNWCQSNEGGVVESCSGNKEKNSVVKAVMERNDSYNKTGEGAIYKITLTPDIVKEIRGYNKDNPYDDLNLSLNENNKYTSDYLDILIDKGYLEVNNSSKR